MYGAAGERGGGGANAGKHKLTRKIKRTGGSDGSVTAGIVSCILQSQQVMAINGATTQVTGSKVASVMKTKQTEFS